MTLPLQSSARQLLEVNGSWGQFGGTNGSPLVYYLQTSVSPGGSGTPESELASLLVPVREIFAIENLTFDQILQRDLDDHRVATELIPYLIDKPGIPKFFPPILAVVVPFINNQILSHYSEPKKTTVPQGDGAWEKHESNFGGVYSISRFFEVDSATYTRNAVLGLNRQKARLMVVDGQHRAMALLALQRNLLNSWEQSRGASYKHFYSAINLNSISVSDLDKIELPVCICMFPELTEVQKDAPSLSEVCRKIFLDVNRQARQPSESRNILMDDYDLRAVFTRRIFSLAKSDTGVSSRLKLRHVEYDNPKDRIQVRKGVAITNVRTIENAIEWLTVRDDEYFTDIRKSLARGNVALNRPRLQRTLELEDYLSPGDLESWGIQIAEIATDNFPPAAREQLAKAFDATWGSLIIRFLSEYRPYLWHVDAVEFIYARHESAEGEERLARQGLFEGQGLFFILEKHFLHQEDARGRLGSSLTPEQKEREVPKTSAELAWKHMERWMRTIEEDRASRFYQKKQVSKEEVDACERVYTILRTQAFQIGALMALGYLVQKLSLRVGDDQVNRWISLASQCWEEKKVKENLYDRSRPGGLLTIYPGTLSPTDWPFFRYTFFEQILWGIKKTADQRDLQLNQVVTDAVAIGRELLIERVARKLASDKKRQNQQITPQKAKDQAVDLVRKALKKTFGVTNEEFKVNLVARNEVNTSEPDDINTEEEDSGITGEPEPE